MKDIIKLFDLTGKTALITGASSGLGEQFACILSSAGARVILAARRMDKLQALQARLPNAFAIKMDITDKVSVQKAFKELDAQGEHIDICINNAGYFKETPIFDNKENTDFESMMQTNVMGVWYVTKQVAIHMKNLGIHGSIINISSVNGDKLIRINRAGYCTSKAAIIQMTKALVSELAKEKIRINCIIPGLFHTPATDYKVDTEEKRQAILDSIPLGIVATPSDLDGLILYLASNNASRYLTGSCITIDGGISWNSDGK